MKTHEKFIRVLILLVPSIFLILSYQNCGNKMAFKSIDKLSLAVDENDASADSIELEIVNSAGYEWMAGSAASAEAVMPGYSTEDYYTLWEVDGEYSIIPTHMSQEYGEEWMELWFYPSAGGQIHLKVIVMRKSDNSIFAEKTKTFNVLNSDSDCIFCDGFED